MARDDTLDLTIRSDDAPNLVLPTGLEVGAVTTSGKDFYQYHFTAVADLDFDLADLVPDLEFNQYRSDLIAFLSHRQRIIDDLSSRDEPPPAP